MNKSLKLLVPVFQLCALMSWWPAAPALAAPNEVDSVIAVVGEQVITQREWMQRMESLRMQNPGQAEPQDLGERVLDALVLERLQVQAGLDMGVVVSDSDVDQAEQRVAASNGLSLPDFLSRLAARGISPAGFRTSLREQLIIERAREQVVAQRVTLSAGAVSAYINENATLFPPMIELAHLLIKVPETASPVTQDRALVQALNWVEQARNGADLAQLAAGAPADSVQLDPSMGMKPSSDYPSLFAQAVERVAVGEIADPVTSGAGVHILKLLAREPARRSVLEPQARARHILWRSETEEQRRDAIAQAKSLRNRILAGQEAFADAAKRVSQDSSAAAGGDLGWARAGDFVPEFEAALNALEPQAVSQPVVTRFGVHLIQLLGRRQSMMDDAALSVWARNQLRAQQGQQVITSWLRELRAATEVRRMGR